jgi:hypothetical protein
LKDKYCQCLSVSASSLPHRLLLPQVSHELARRNEQLKKDFANETSKYKTLVLAFEDLFLEFKDALDAHGLHTLHLSPSIRNLFDYSLILSLGSSLTNGLPSIVSSISLSLCLFQSLLLSGKRGSPENGHSK